MEFNRLSDEIRSIVQQSNELPMGGLGSIARVEVGLVALIALEKIVRQQNSDPTQLLESLFESAKGILSAARSIAPDLDIDPNSNTVEVGVGHTVDLFENAWTTYSTKTYDHSLGLIMNRLKSSGFDENYFADKVCFDGGCGTGRLSLAMALMGAKKVTAVDLGSKSLEYFKEVLRRYDVKTVEVVEHDVTNLSPWKDGEYDFVASHGVLHHTENCKRGLAEHFRITKPGGAFWVYLYGSDGFYWQVYDMLKPVVIGIAPNDIRKILRGFGLREGLIYTYLDNFLAPREYWSCDGLVDFLKQFGEFDWDYAKGVDEIDDTKISLATVHGAEILGPQGEVRLVFQKK